MEGEQVDIRAIAEDVVKRRASVLEALANRDRGAVSVPSKSAITGQGQTDRKCRRCGVTATWGVVTGLATVAGYACDEHVDELYWSAARAEAAFGEMNTD